MSTWCNRTIVLAASSLPFVVHVTVNAILLSKKKKKKDSKWGKKTVFRCPMDGMKCLGYCKTLKKPKQQTLNSMGNLNLRTVLPSSCFAVEESCYVKFAFFRPPCPCSNTKVRLLLNLTSFRVQAIPNLAFVAAKPGALRSSLSTFGSSNGGRGYRTALVQFVFSCQGEDFRRK